MADQSPKTQLEASKHSLPSNEDLVNSLVTDFTNQYISNEEENKVEDNKIEQKTDVESQNMPLNDFDKEIAENVDNEDVQCDNDNDINEIELQELEKSYTEDQKNEYRKEAENLKLSANELFKTEQFESSIELYTQALKLCPLAFNKDRAILYANRAAAKLKLGLKESAVTDCTKAIELDSEYKKAYLRRAQTYKDLDKLDEALEDYKALLNFNPSDKALIDICKELSIQISEKNEKLKTEMLGQLKNLGNMILRPFGLSTNNFQMVQDPNTGGYSINFCQNANN